MKCLCANNWLFPQPATVRDDDSSSKSCEHILFRSSRSYLRGSRNFTFNMFMDLLPKSVLHHILVLLDEAGICSIACCSRYLHDCVDEGVWCVHSSFLMILSLFISTIRAHTERVNPSSRTHVHRRGFAAKKYPPKSVQSLPPYTSFQVCSICQKHGNCMWPGYAVLMN